MYLKPALWQVSAPACFPSPMVIIFIMPLSKGPLKEVWGFTRQLTIMPSASAAFRSMKTSVPSSFTPIFLTSIEEIIGQPTLSGVMP